MNGVLVIDKPDGWTSFDVVAKLRGISREKKIGHTGTLDPMATGVLPLLLGRAAKAADLLPDTSKVYCARFRLGEKTDTGDITGTVTETSDARPCADVLKKAMTAFTGVIRQVPPMYSAVSVGGQRLYTLARQGKTVERESREVFIERLELLAYTQEHGEGTLTVSCSKGTYIRTLIEDIAKHAGTVGVMSGLRRVSACGFTQEDALSINKAEELALAGLLQQRLRSVESLFEGYAQVQVSEAQARRFKNGGALDLQRLRGVDITGELPVKVHDPEGGFLGLGKLLGESLAVLKLFGI